MHFVTGLVTLASAASLVSAAAAGPPPGVLSSMDPKSQCHTYCGRARAKVRKIADEAEQAACSKCEDKCTRKDLIDLIKNCYGCAGNWSDIQDIYRFVPDKNAPPACWKAESSPGPKLEDDESSNMIGHGNNEHKKTDERKKANGEPKETDEHKEHQDGEQHMETGEHMEHKDTKEQKVTNEVKNQMIVENKAGNNKTEAQKDEQGQKVPLSSSAAGGFHQPVVMVAGIAAALVLGMM